MAEQKTRNLQTLWQVMKGKRLLYFAAIISIGLATFFSFFAPLVVRTIIDSIIGNQKMDAPKYIEMFVSWVGGTTVLRHNLWMASIFLVCIAFVRGIFDYLRGRWSASASESIAKNLREKLYQHLQRVPEKFYSKQKTGDLVQRCTSDVETVRTFLAVQIVEVGRSLMMLFLVIPIMLSMDVAMTFVAMTLVPFIIIFAVFYFLRVKKFFKESDEAEGAMSAVLQENLTGARVVRAFARQDFEMEKFDEKNQQYRDKTFRLIKLLGGYWGFSDLLIYSQTGLVLILGTIWTIEGKITLGTLVAFFTYEEFLLWPVRQAGRTLTEMGKALVSIGRIKEILDAPIEDNSGKTNFKIHGQIEFRNVGFSYESNKEILKNITFSIAPGETIMIFGPTGSGKSTLVNLLPRLWDYDSGSILLDGMKLNTLSRKAVREQIGIVLQEPFLYSKTLRENIIANIKSVDEQQFHDASRIASVHDEILSFEKGYETFVGERGVTLSGGQRQRVAIARTILQNPPVLIFDDSLSALDTETEKRIQDAMQKRKGKATTIVISHRLTSTKFVDKIIVLENGGISAIGTHDELIKSSGLYQNIFELQTAKTNE
ncbi:MAG: ABC transporter ATP-binding protein [Candidatus Marinimicrobia bacterium]|nr:ABC transporter ATP-binding protein [Candidatus Neomarinimicrobiota bacterium]